MEEITLEEWEHRKRFAGFTEEDEKLLKGAAKKVDKIIDEVVDGLYSQFLRFTETAEFFPDDETLVRVKGTQREYFRSLFAGEYGKDYADYRLNIGRVHHSIGLSPQWYMGGVLRLCQSYGPPRPQGAR